MTTREIEWEKHMRWKISRQPAMQPLFDALFENEFLSEDELHNWQSRDLTALIHFAVAQVPHYRDLFVRLNLIPGDVRSLEDLQKVPILQKPDVSQLGKKLLAQHLPIGEQLAGCTRTSGTTGQPLEIVQSISSVKMFYFLWHRQARWFDLDPKGTFVDVRFSREVQQDSQGRPNPDGVVVQRPQWRYLGKFCETGREFGFNVSNPREQQVAWLKALCPQYTMSTPGLLEEWLFANNGVPPTQTLKGMIAIGSQLTESLRRRLEESYGLPIHQTYGLNEFGKVALRCEAGRYHVHTEHCLVEIVTADGLPCLPGQTGHLLVTGFRNFAMPLIRYDTGDLAEVVAGPCPCGRTLPSIGEIAGRFRRFAGLPTGTRERVRMLLETFAHIPPELFSFLRRYQIHQDRENRFTIRLQTVSPIPEKFCEYFRRAWQPVAGCPPVPLDIVEVSTIPLSRGGKLLDFVSDLTEDSYSTTTEVESL